jgi:hypothetical protein
MQLQAVLSEIQQKNKEKLEANLKIAVNKIDKKKLQKEAKLIGKYIQSIVKKYPEIKDTDVFGYNFFTKGSCSCEKTAGQRVYKELFHAKVNKLRNDLEDQGISKQKMEREIIMASIDCPNFAQLKKIFNLK